MVINTNTAANKGSRLLAESTTRLQKSLTRLTSGSKINSPEDDAAGLAVATKMDSQLGRISAVQNNLASATSFSQTQDGYLAKVSKALDRMSELATLALDNTKVTADKTNYQTEFLELQKYISDIGQKDFNGVSLFATASLAVTLDSDGNTFNLSDAKVNANTDISAVLATTFVVTSAVSTLKTAITANATTRAGVGAQIQRLNMTGEQIAILGENLASAVSRIKDVDVAEESTQYSRFNILVQSGTAMLAQANMLPQSSLRLLQ